MTVGSVPLSGLSLWVCIPSRRLADAKLDKAEQAAAAQERAQERFEVAQRKVGAWGKLVWLLRARQVFHDPLRWVHGANCFGRYRTLGQPTGTIGSRKFHDLLRWVH